MTVTLQSNAHDRLLRRELAGPRKYTSVKGLYGDKSWVKDLDIINELDGHSGCVNALSWSKNGRLLASGSDDQHINIHEYLPDASLSSFKHATSISTGHSANIFSVKFMPHSNDRTIVSAAGDRQIRVFDIEYAGGSTNPEVSDVRSSTRAQGMINRGVQYLSPSDTNARIYRSHSDRVKRIVTESSPYLFLSCSEDGEVRQWDLRQPSFAYPAPRNRDGWLSVTEDHESGVPPPLISYKRHSLDINTISCSPSQPHYIALGGAHLHCFLHDRRMLGRDKLRERGERAASGSNASSDREDGAMTEATQCVRKFAPHGEQKMRRGASNHITACKISDARPNEMVVSWSGDHIYSFDLVRSPNAGEREDTPEESRIKRSTTARANESRDRKRKRAQNGSSLSNLSQDGGVRASSKATRRPPSHAVKHDANEEVSLRVNYENGQSESIPVRQATPENWDLARATEASMSEADRTPYRIANTTVKIRKQLFTLEDAREPSDQDPTGHGRNFTSALGCGAAIMDDMNEIRRTWKYPVGPNTLDVAYQTTLRRHRESACRFVQAAGVISRVLGGNLQTAGRNQHLLDLFIRIQPLYNELPIQDESEAFRYDFIRAICLWLDSGPGALVDGFTGVRHLSRYPIHADSSIDAIDDVIIPYLLRMASDESVPNIDASRFEVDGNRRVFSTEKAAVLAFARALKMPFEDLSGAVTAPSRDAPVAAQDRKTALKFWGLKVARGLLLKAGEGVNHSYVDQAFGGICNTMTSAQTQPEERTLRTQVEDIDPEEEDPVVDAVRVGRGDAEGSADDMVDIEDVRAAISEFNRPAREGGGDGEVDAEEDDYEEAEEDDDEEEEGDEAERDEATATDPDDDNDNSDQEDSDSSESDAVSNLLFRSAFTRRNQRRNILQNVPTTASHRTYTGHCNVKTVKDVDFYGLNDEYVVSGSDDGNVFIWDRQTSELLNVLEGDGEVVNVVQGHPYEPMLAVSGIDSTVKIFSPDAKARRDARMGIGVSAADDRNFSSLHFGQRRRMSHLRRTAADRVEAAREREREEEASIPGLLSADGTSVAPDNDNDNELTGIYDDDDDEAPPALIGEDSDDSDYFEGQWGDVVNGLASRRRMQDSYTIRAENDANRRNQQRDTFITRSMLAQLAGRMGVGMRRVRRRNEQTGEVEEVEEMGTMFVGGPGEEGERVVVGGEDCCVM